MIYKASELTPNRLYTLYKASEITPNRLYTLYMASDITPNRPGVSVSNTELPRHRLEAHVSHLVYISRRGVESEVISMHQDCVFL